MKPLRVVFSILLFSHSPILSQTTGALDTDFRIVLSNNHAEPAGIVAALTTTTVYPCEGYRIQTRTVHNRDTITIHIGGMIRPGPCFAMFGPAKGEAFLGNLRPGTHYLRIQYRGETDLYKLTFEHRYVDITRVRTRFTELNGHLLYE